jgi:hypothetical protein
VASNRNHARRSAIQRYSPHGPNHKRHLGSTWNFNGVIGCVSIRSEESITINA